MPDPTRLLNTLRKAVQACQDMPGRRGRFIELTDVEHCLIVGDLHGHLGNFKKVLELAQLAKHPRRHLVVQELIHSPENYPHGGDVSHRLVDLVAALKCQYPHRVHYLLGNHELSQWTERAIQKNGVDLNQHFRLGINTAYGSHGAEIYAAYMELFAALPVAIRLPNRVFLSHSVPHAKNLEKWDLTELFREEATEADFMLGGYIHAVVWGRDLAQATVEQYLAKVECDLLISGHIPCAGFMQPNSRQLIVDCKDNDGCVCLVPCDRIMTMAELLHGVQRLNANPE